MNWPEHSQQFAGDAPNLLLLPAAYGIGCLSFGYYLVRWRTGRDLRAAGSGGTGATNVGRELGRMAFVLTLLLDAAKGGLVVWLGNLVEGGPRLGWLLTLAAVAGHVWPVQLRFRGGKGIAALLGALLILEPRILLLIALAFPIAWALVRSFTRGGLLALAVTPLLLPSFHAPLIHSAGLAMVLVVVLWAHRGHWQGSLRRSKNRTPRSDAVNSPLKF